MNIIPMSSSLIIALLAAFTFCHNPTMDSAIHPSQPWLQPDSLFVRLWVYPDMPDSLLNFVSTEEHEARVCKMPPPWEKDEFGNIRGMGCDAANNLYVWDDGYPALCKFSPSGQLLLRRRINDTINGVTISHVSGAFAVAPNGESCVGDLSSKTLTLLDPNGNVMSNFKIGMLPATIVFGKDASLFVAGFEMFYSGPIVHHYSRTGKLLAQFCERDKLSKLVMMTGNAGRLAADAQGNVYYSFFYPYKIVKFSPSGDSLACLSHLADELKPPSREGPTVSWKSGVRGLTVLPKSFLLSVVYTAQNQWSIDVFNSDGSWVRRLPSSALPHHFNFRYWATDQEGNIYFDIINNDKNFIVKYGVSLSALTHHH
jgi:hypothetical protein